MLLSRLYEGCASRTIGRPEEATIVKFHTTSPKVTYLFSPTFDTEPHPPIRTSMQISLQDLHVRYRDYNLSDNPPLIHQKDEVVTPDYPSYKKFAKLSQQEKDWGLLDDLSSVYHLHSWQKFLVSRCAELKGHRLVWKKGADPYQKRIAKAAIRARKSRIDVDA